MENMHSATFTLNVGVCLIALRVHSEKHIQTLVENKARLN